MGRVVSGVVVGYVALAACVFFGLTGLYLVLGADRSFEPDTYDPSVTWLVPQFVVMTAAALAGGWVARAIGRRPAAPVALAVLAAVLGLAEAVLTAEKPDPGPRTGEVGNMEAMTKAKRPRWAMFVTPLVGFVGIPVGGRAWKNTSAKTTVDPEPLVTGQ